jgi:hypothetical protein
MNGWIWQSKDIDLVDGGGSLGQPADLSHHG